jgi:thiamine transport system ATP-binding protein
MPFIEWRSVTRDFGGVRGLDSFTLGLEAGEVLAVIGPSGSGKSTLLRLTAGLERPTSGAILRDGVDLAGIPVHRRGFGLMFQDYSLFPHLSVEQNVGFGLRMTGWTAARRRDRVREMLRLVRMEDMARRDVLTLSGGEQQRVALARSLAPQPGLLMLDEPLGALDAELRGSLLDELARILHSVRVTVLYVTHDHGEAMAVASRIAVLNQGRLEHAGTPLDLVREPASAFVASFLRLGAVLRRPGERPALVRPEDVRFTPGPGTIAFSVRLVSRVPGPRGLALSLALDDGTGGEQRVTVTRPFGEMDAAADVRTVWVDPRAVQVLPR